VVVASGTNGDPAPVFRTLIVRHVECLTARQQVSFAAWLRRSTDTQIISIAGMPVFPLVQEGRFLDELYYFLNVVLLESAGGRS
jgi:DNA-binding NtrC family response regulator